MTISSGRWVAVLAGPLVLALAGCVERHMIITTDPPFAAVFDERNLPLSATPADKFFVYYGKYRFTLVKDGYETLVVEEDVRPPWFEWFPVDFISENVIPWTIRDVRRFHYKLQPAAVVSPEQVLEQGKPLRARGLVTGEPVPPSLRQPQPGSGRDIPAPVIQPGSTGPLPPPGKLPTQ